MDNKKVKPNYKERDRKIIIVHIVLLRRNKILSNLAILIIYII